MDNFDKEAFIGEVEKRPVIWDTDCPEYSDRILKKKAWEELTEIFADPSYSKEKKSIFNMQLQRKWKNLRDTYIKEYKKINANSPFVASRTSHYIYYTRLSFLQKCLTNKVMTPSNDSRDMEVDQVAKATELLNSMKDSLSELMETASSLEKSSNKSKASESSHNFLSCSHRAWEKRNPWKTDSVVDMVQPMMRTHKQSSSKRDKDNDKLFCLSLYKEIKKVPEQNRLDAKIELLRVLRTAQMFPLNETQISHQDVKPAASPVLFERVLETRFSPRNPSGSREVIGLRNDLASTIKSEDALRQYLEHSRLSYLRKQSKDRMEELVKSIRRSSSDSSISSFDSAKYDKTMDVSS